VRNPAATRAMVANYHAPESTLEVNLPDYQHLKHPLIEVFTLDSDTCAACTYMLRAAQDAVRQTQEHVDLVEYKFTRPENIARVKKMGVKNLPSIYINGELKFSSIIPSQQELLAAMKESRKEPV
ncbi:MAG: thioredoxin family protein, partial [Anaerolineaceae bacterium]